MSTEAQKKVKLHDEGLRSKKKAMAIFLGNAGDVDGLVGMLNTETDISVLLQVITILGSMARVETIPHLLALKERVIDEKVIIAIDTAVLVIRKHSSYS